MRPVCFANQKLLIFQFSSGEAHSSLNFFNTWGTILFISRVEIFLPAFTGQTVFRLAYDLRLTNACSGTCAKLRSLCVSRDGSRCSRCSYREKALVHQLQLIRFRLQPTLGLKLVCVGSIDGLVVMDDPCVDTNNCATWNLGAFETQTILRDAA